MIFLCDSKCSLAEVFPIHGESPAPPARVNKYPIIHRLSSFFMGHHSFQGSFFSGVVQQEQLDLWSEVRILKNFTKMNLVKL